MPALLDHHLNNPEQRCPVGKLMIVILDVSLRQNQPGSCG
jgi:hypothetical protein